MYIKKNLAFQTAESSLTNEKEEEEDESFFDERYLFVFYINIYIF